MNSTTTRPTLTCLSKGICSNDFRILDASETVIGELTFEGFFGRMFLTYQGARYVVKRGGTFLHVLWDLVPENAPAGTAPLAVAEPKFAFVKARFEIEAQGQKYALDGRDPFEIFMGETVRGSIQPMHGLTKRTLITCDPSVPLLIQLFCFALVRQKYRQDAAASSN